MNTEMVCIILHQGFVNLNINKTLILNTHIIDPPHFISILKKTKIVIFPLKTISVFFVLLLCSCYINAQEQDVSCLDKKLSIVIENESIEYILEKIGLQIGCIFAYSSENILANRIVSLQVKNKTIHLILKDLFPESFYQFKEKKDTILIYSKNKTATYTVSGYVTESGSQEYLTAASIYNTFEKKGVTTNNYGFYSLQVPRGEQEFTCSFLGYNTLKKKITIKKDTILNIDLDPSTEFLDEVIVVSDNISKQSTITRMSSIRIKPSEIEETPVLLGEKDVLKTLQLLPGVQAGTEGGSGMHVRGGTPDQNLIILDEATLYNTNHFFGFFSVLNGDAIKSTELFKGGFPAEFGGRLSSFLRVDTKNGNKQKFSGKINIGLISSSLLLEGPIKKNKTSFIFNARRTYADLLINPFLDPNEQEAGVPFFYDLNFKVHHVFSDRDKLFLSNYLGKDDFTTQDKREGNQSNQSLAYNNITSTLRWNHQFNDKLFLNTSLIYSNYNLKIKFDRNTDDDIFIYNSNSGINDFGFKIDANYYPNTRHTIKGGAITTYHNFTPQQTSIQQTGEEDISSLQKLNSLESAIYVEDDWQLSDTFSIASGVRLSHFNHTSSNYLNLEPRITLAWKPKPNTAIKASFANVNQYIHLLTNSGTGLSTDLWVSSTERIAPQNSKQIALGFVKDFKKTSYTLSVEGYYKKLNNVIAYKQGASFINVQDLETAQNIDWQNNITFGQGWSYGTEILVRKQKGSFTGWMGYTLSWSQRQFEEINFGKRFNAKYDRRHDLSIVGIYKPSKKITYSGSWVYSSGINYTVPNVEALDLENQFVINQGLIGNPTPSTFATTINNFKGESTHRLDVSVQFHKITKRNRERTWGVSIYNTYARKNPSFYGTTDSSLVLTDNNTTGQRTFRKVSLLVFVPSINYTLKF